MSFLFKRLNALSPRSEIEVTYRLPLILADGVDETDDGLASADLGVMRTFFTASLDTRISALEAGGGTPSYWPTLRTITLTGPFTGSVSLDGSADVELAITVPAGSLGISAINTLGPTLVSMDNQLTDHEGRIAAAESALATNTAVSADKWSTARTLSLSGKATGSVSWDGSADAELQVTGLSGTKADVGLGNVDNTSDANKPISSATQTALNNKVDVGNAAADYMGSAPSYYNATAAVDVNNFLGGSRALVAQENANTPGASQTFWYIETIKTYTTATSLMQRAYGYQSGELWTRHCFGGVWGAWRRQWDSTNFDPATKATLASSPQFNGTVMSKSGSFIAKALANNDANVIFRDEADDDRGMLLWDRTADVLRLRRFNTTTGAVEGEMAVGPTNMTYNGYEVWHANTFNPATKLDTTATAAAATKLATSRNFSLTGVITATAVGFDGSGNVALATAVADGALSIAKTSGLQTALNAKAPIDDPTFTGVPAAPTAVVGTNTTQIATTAFVNAEIANDAPSKTGTGASGTWGINVSGTAAKLATARAFSLTGVITAAAVNFDGSAAVALATAIADNALTIAKTSGLQGALDGKVDTSSVSMADLANTIVQRNGSADIQARLFRPTFANQTTMSGAVAFRVNDSTDNYIRFLSTPGPLRTWLGLDTNDAVTFGATAVTRLSVGLDPGYDGSIGCTNWFRSSGNTGWYSQTWGIGIYATDATYVRTYNGAQMAAADFVISSDRRLKAGIRNFEFRGRLRPVNYYHREGHKADFGFIAQEVQALYPEAVGKMGDTGMLQLSYPKLTAVLSYQVNKLEDELAEVRQQVAQLLAQRQPWWKRLFRRKDA